MTPGWEAEEKDLSYEVMKGNSEVEVLRAGMERGRL